MTGALGGLILPLIEGKVMFCRAAGHELDQSNKPGIQAHFMPGIANCKMYFQKVYFIFHGNTTKKRGFLRQSGAKSLRSHFLILLYITQD